MSGIYQLLAQLDTSSLPDSPTSPDVFPKVINIVLGMIGAVAVLLIVIAGIRYITSRGDPQAVTKAKNTILYAVIGLVVALTATAIVNFVVSNLAK